MLDPPKGSNAWTRWLVELYWPLRSRVEWGKPIPFDSIYGYLAMKGHQPADLFDWILTCDDSVVGWMNEETERRHKDLTRTRDHGGRTIRH